MSYCRYGTKRNKVLYDIPNIKSPAALVLLSTKLGEENLQDWLQFRNEFFDTQEPLICMHCGKTGLVREIEDMRNEQQRELLATIEHITAKANGGLHREYSNLGVACFPCNNKKKDMSIEEFYGIHKR